MRLYFPLYVLGVSLRRSLGEGVCGAVLCVVLVDRGGRRVGLFDVSLYPGFVLFPE